MTQNDPWVDVSLNPNTVKNHSLWHVWTEVMKSGFTSAQNLRRGQLHSRQKSQTKYNVWIQYDIKDSNDPVRDYYCVSTVAKRTVGMCAHTASTLYFLDKSIIVFFPVLL